jgi:Tfp pilus assembly protein PilZ
MEKRKSDRILKRLEVRFHTDVDTTAITNDLSETGIFIRTNSGVETGTSMDLKLNLPNTQEIFLSGKVVRGMTNHPGLVGSSHSGMGVEIINPSPDYREYIRSLQG